MSDTALRNHEHMRNQESVKERLANDREKRKLAVQKRYVRDMEKISKRQEDTAYHQERTRRKIESDASSRREEILSTMTDDDAKERRLKAERQAKRDISRRRRYELKKRLVHPISGAASDHKYNVAVTDGDIYKQRIKHRINKFDKATNKGGFKVKSFESNLKFGSMQKMPVPKMKPAKMDLSMKSFNDNIGSLDKKLSNFSFGDMKASKIKRNRRYRKSKKKKRR